MAVRIVFRCVERAEGGLTSPVLRAGLLRQLPRLSAAFTGLWLIVPSSFPYSEARTGANGRGASD